MQVVTRDTSSVLNLLLPPNQGLLYLPNGPFLCLDYHLRGLLFIAQFALNSHILLWFDALSRTLSNSIVLLGCHSLRYHVSTDCNGHNNYKTVIAK